MTDLTQSTCYWPCSKCDQCAGVDLGAPPKGTKLVRSISDGSKDMKEVRAVTYDGSNLDEFNAHANVHDEF